MAKHTASTRDARRLVQKAGGPAIVEDAKLPRMGEAPSPVDGQRPRAMMPDAPAADTGKARRMAAVRGKADAREGLAPAKGLKDQIAAPSRTQPEAAVADGPGYLRLRVVVEDGELHLAGGAVVDGPLHRPETLHAGVAYEVTVDGKRVATGQVLDAGVNRSFPDPAGRPAMSGHHTTIPRRYEVTVRVPLDAVSVSALGRAEISLYRWRGQPAEPTGATSIRNALGRQVETIGRLKGIPLADLPKRVQTRVRRAATASRPRARKAGLRRK